MIFRAYDIRGVYGRDFNDDFAKSIGRAFGSTVKGKVIPYEGVSCPSGGRDMSRTRDLPWSPTGTPTVVPYEGVSFRDMSQTGTPTVVVGRDMRLSGEKLSKKLIEGLRSTGVDVIDIGVVPTPLVYFAAYSLKCGNGVMITASHNPPEYNGFKFIRDYETLHGKQILELKDKIEKSEYKTGKGSLKEKNIILNYINFVKEKISINKKLKVVLDSGNGMAGILAPKLLEELGCEIIELYSELDGRFPNHHPDPTVDENLKDLVGKVVDEKADYGVGFDGDGDRAGFVDDKGRIIRGDQALILFSREILKKQKNAKIIYEVKCSQALEEEIVRNHGIPIMYRTGHSYIKQKIKQENAALAGEMSGHFYFADNYFGYDDAIYAAARMAELLSKSNESLSVLVDGMPKYYSTPEIRVECPDDRKFQVVDSVTKEFQEKYEVNTIDGARVKFNHGWGLVRASNTQPALILRMESKTQKGLEEIKKKIKSTVEKHLK